MSKGNTPRAAVPAHIFESMLRGALSGDNSFDAWKDELQHWSFTAHQLDQLVSELKKGETAELDKKLAKEIIDFIEKKIRD
ncbi:MAG: hypothetical protein HYZ14_15990 [Bacteroidetes bacterium]|nr:hypothetical protein [Bacteroidota bacterium]